MAPKRQFQRSPSNVSSSNFSNFIRVADIVLAVGNALEKKFARAHYLAVYSNGSEAVLVKFLDSLESVLYPL